MDAIIPFWGLVVVFTVGGIIFSLSLTPKGQTPSDQKLHGTDFTPSQMFIGRDNRGGLAINERTRQFCLFTSPTSPPRVLPITDLLGSYLINNGEVLGESTRNHPHELVKFLEEVRGPKEGLTNSLHKKSSNGPNQRIDLVVVVHDQNNPIHTVNFLDMDTKEGGILFEKAISTAKHWHCVLDGLILQADQLAKVQTENPQGQEMAKATP